MRCCISSNRNFPLNSNHPSCRKRTHRTAITNCNCPSFTNRTHYIHNGAALNVWGRFAQPGMHTTIWQVNSIQKVFSVWGRLMQPGIHTTMWEVHIMYKSCNKQGNFSYQKPSKKLWAPCPQQLCNIHKTTSQP